MLSTVGKGLGGSPWNGGKDGCKGIKLPVKKTRKTVNSSSTGKNPLPETSETTCSCLVRLRLGQYVAT